MPTQKKYLDSSGVKDLFHSVLDILDITTDTVQEAIDLKADVASPELTGTPTAPTATTGNNSNQIATTAFVVSMLNNIAPVESNINRASKNYEIGEYLINGGQLYRVTGAIAQNTAITIGTNVEATTIWQS